MHVNDSVGIRPPCGSAKGQPGTDAHGSIAVPPSQIQHAGVHAWDNGPRVQWFNMRVRAFRVGQISQRVGTKQHPMTRSAHPGSSIDEDGGSPAKNG
jgi:hypothetical protein